MLADKVTLHVEHELTTFKAFSCRFDIKRGNLRDIEEASRSTCISVRPIEGEECRGRTG